MKFYYYFAYGSNMDITQMRYRCPKSVPIGAAVLRNYALVERQFADIDYSPGNAVHGLLWRVSSDCLKCLDRYEGYPHAYTRKLVNVSCKKAKVRAVVYEMTPEVKQSRNGVNYASSYRELCAKAAKAIKIPNHFELETVKSN
jgi:gamma-glutamylcyclotransferase (GGCT)/AIG2-like uncharacterized protein YtfP